MLFVGNIGNIVNSITTVFKFGKEILLTALLLYLSSVRKIVNSITTVFKFGSTLKEYLHWILCCS